MAQPQYAEVILPLPLNATFTYSIPDSMQGKVMPGHRVIVPFGRSKFYTAIVQTVTPIAPEGIEVKEIAARLDDTPVVRHPQLKMWQWIADYYLCSIGDVYKAALPAGLKVESETMVQINEDFDDDPNGLSSLSERESMVYSTLLTAPESGMSLKDIEKNSGLSTVNSIVNSMIEKGAVRVSERLNERYRVKRVAYVRLTIENDADGVNTEKAFEKVKGAPRQETMLLTLMQLSGYNRRGSQLEEVTRESLIDRSQGTSATLRELEKKQLVEVYHKEVSRFRYTGPEACPLPELSDAQTLALKTIHKSFYDHNVTLLHGVTSSGKTEVYIHLIDYVLSQGNSTLFLVPEIALTTQLTTRLQRVFGEKVVIYHSRFSDNERVEIWRRLLNSTTPCVVIGARSAVFLPFARLGLVIVDEEHDSSYKQQDPAPRYNGRDAAIVLASMHGAKVLLGSATPAIDTYYKAETGKYGLATISTRYGSDSTLPDIEIVDMNLERRRGAVQGVFSNTAISAIRKAVADGKQAIIFRNRRGYAPVAICRHCEYIPRCTNCDVSLTYHRNTNTLECHYCGATYSMPELCPVCKEPSIEISGYGTERLEDDVTSLFPEARILRMDLDTTRAKESHAALVDKFSQHKADILVGTQMVTKGLDFAGVQVVAIPDADSLIYHPDFRSTERAFAMLEQVAGRAGRRGSQGKGLVIVQTKTPSHPLLSRIKTHDYAAHYAAELEERRLYSYPPFTRVIYIYLKHRDASSVEQMSAAYAEQLRRLFGTRVFGPEKPSVSRVQQLYIRKIMLKVELQASMRRVKEILLSLHANLHAKSQTKGLIIYYDVDPQ